MGVVGPPPTGVVAVGLLLPIGLPAVVPLSWEAFLYQLLSPIEGIAPLVFQPDLRALAISVPYLKGGTLRASLTMSTYFAAMRSRPIPMMAKKASGAKPPPRIGEITGKLTLLSFVTRLRTPKKPSHFSVNLPGIIGSSSLQNVRIG